MHPNTEFIKAIETVDLATAKALLEQGKISASIVDDVFIKAIQNKEKNRSIITLLLPYATTNRNRNFGVGSLPLVGGTGFCIIALGFFPNAPVSGAILLIAGATSIAIATKQLWHGWKNNSAIESTEHRFTPTRKLAIIMDAGSSTHAPQSEPEHIPSATIPFIIQSAEPQQEPSIDKENI